MKGEKRNITVLPPLTNENAAQIMAERIKATRTENTVVPMLWQGILKMEIPVDGDNRTATAYVPKDIPQGVPFVLMNIPEGEESVDFLEKSGWLDLADREQFCIFAAEPSDRRWGSREAEADYLKACYNAEKTGRYLFPQISVHVVGYGTVGTELHKLVMEDPLFVASAAFLDASHMDSTFMAQQWERMIRFGKETFEIPAAGIPVPVWIADENADGNMGDAARFWISAAKAEKAEENSVYGTCYRQAEDISYTPEGHILEVYAGNQVPDFSSPETTEKLYGFLRRFFRYGRGSRSNMISRKVDYKALDVRFHRFDDANGIAREYLVYVPASCEGKKDLPLVIALHGASQSMRNMFENGLWYEIADKEEFIVAMAESGLGMMPPDLKGNLAVAHRPLWHDVLSGEPDTDIPYIGELTERIACEYPVDRTRIYLTGHSMGAMTSLYLGTTEIANRFAAVAATSGIAMKPNRVEAGHISGLPVYLTMGEFDLWSSEIDKTSKLTDAIDTYLKDNGLATAETAAEVRINSAEQSEKGIFHDYTWYDKNGVPRVKYSWIEGWGHVNFPQPNARFWEEWFSRWRLSENGERIYEERR